MKKPMHPGKILWDEYIIPYDISVYDMANESGISPALIYALTREKASLTKITCIKLAKYFGVPVDYWLSLRNEYDLWQCRKIAGKIKTKKKYLR